MLSSIRETSKFEKDTEEELTRILEDVKRDYLAGKDEQDRVQRADESRRMSAEDIEQENIVRG